MRTVRHEVGHAIFPVLYPYEAIKWKIIGNLFHSVDRPYFFQSRSLGDASPHNTCSGGPGHEKYNPEDAFSCGMGSGN